MILYDSKKEMIAVSPEILDFLGFESIDEMTDKVDDIAELFVNKPGYIYNFKNFSWIDYIIFNKLKAPKVIIKTLTNELETELIVNELIDKKNRSKYYCVSFKNLVPVETVSSFEESEPFEGFEEKGFEESFILETEKTKPEEISLKEEPFETVETKAEEPLTINFDEIEATTAPSVEEEIEPTTLIEKVTEKPESEKIYDVEAVAEELGLDKGLIQDLLVEFIAQAYELQPQIMEALNNKDLTLAHNLIHKIKGAAANLRIEKANEILSNTSGINDANILKEYLEQFYNFVEKLNSELMLNVEKPKKEEKETVEEKIAVPEEENRIYNPQTASNELGIPEDIILEFVSEYIKQSFDFEKDLENYIQNNDIDNLKNLLHKLKGSATNLRIEKADEILTSALKSNEIENISNLIKEYYQLLNEIADELNIKIEKNKENISENVEEGKKLTPILEKGAEELGLDIDSYKNFIKEYVEELENIYQTDKPTEIVSIAKRNISMAENLRLNPLKEKLNNIINSTDNLEIEKNLNELKDIIEEIKSI